eukprot:gene16111-31296_t
MCNKAATCLANAKRHEPHFVNNAAVQAVRPPPTALALEPSTLLNAKHGIAVNSDAATGVVTVTPQTPEDAKVYATSNAHAGWHAKQTASESGSAHSRARRANEPWLTNPDSASACYVNDDVKRSLPIGVAFTKKLFIDRFQGSESAATSALTQLTQWVARAKTQTWCTVTERPGEPGAAGSHTRIVVDVGGISEVRTFKTFGYPDIAKQRQLFDDFVNKTDHRSVSDWQFSFGGGANDQDLPTTDDNTTFDFATSGGVAVVERGGGLGVKFTFGEAMVGSICCAGSAYAKGRPKEHLELRDVYYDALKKSTILRESCNIASPEDECD